MMLFKCGLLGIADVYCSTLSGSGVPLYSPWNFLLMQSIQDHVQIVYSLAYILCSINTILTDHKSLPYLLLTTL